MGLLGSVDGVVVVVGIEGFDVRAFDSGWVGAKVSNFHRY